MPLKLDGNKAVGYVALYNSPSKVLKRSDGTPFIEVIKPGAFAKTVAAGGNIMALSSHEKDDVLGSTAAGTLILRDDATGLYAEIDLPDTSAGRDLKTLLARGEPYGGSFKAGVDDWQWSQPPGQDCLLCEVGELTLSEVTVTPFPAYTGTSIVLRSSRHPEIPEIKNVKSVESELYHYRTRLLSL